MNESPTPSGRPAPAQQGALTGKTTPLFERSPAARGEQPELEGPACRTWSVEGVDVAPDHSRPRSRPASTVLDVETAERALRRLPPLPRRRTAGERPDRLKAAVLPHRRRPAVVGGRDRGATPTSRGLAAVERAAARGHADRRSRPWRRSSRRWTRPTCRSCTTRSSTSRRTSRATATSGATSRSPARPPTRGARSGCSATSLLSGLFDRYPNLRIGFAECSARLAAGVARPGSTDQATYMRTILPEVKHTPLEYAQTAGSSAASSSTRAPAIAKASSTSAATAC